MSGKRGVEDERNEDEESISVVSPAVNLPVSTTVSTAPTATDQFTFTPEFRRHFADFVPGNTLMRLRFDEGVERHSGRVHRRGHEERRDYCS